MEKWGIIGIGKLGTALAAQVQSQKIGVYHPNYEKAESFTKNYPHTYALRKSELEKIDYLILSLPAQQISLFLKETNHLLKSTVLINMATSLKTNDLHLQFPNLTIISMKFIGHSNALRLYGNGLFVTAKQKAAHHVLRFFEEIGTVLDADESLVFEVNKTATTYAVEAAVEIEKNLQKQGYEDVLITTALQSMVPEVIRSYVQGTLGHFAQNIVKEIKQKDKLF
ncbi:NAD(P)-binding domain-containing protein [Bacillus taeanensis]|nr:NAD(P)-binding domain-containing protein [Bacillus taeanensis]